MGSVLLDRVAGLSDEGLAAFVSDAIKHYSSLFLRDFIQHIDKTVGRDWFFVGEYWQQ